MPQWAPTSMSRSPGRQMIVEEAAGGVLEAAVLHLLARQHPQARIVAETGRDRHGKRGRPSAPVKADGTTDQVGCGGSAERRLATAPRPRSAASAVSSVSTSAKTWSQSRGVRCRNSRTLGIPGAVGALAQPAPVRVVHQHHPDRAAQGAGQVGHRAVGHQHEVEPLDQRRRVGEIVEQRAGVDDQRIGAQRLQLLEPRPFLQAVELHARDGGEAQVGGEPGRAVGIVGEGDAARPDDPDLEPVAGARQQRVELAAQTLGRRQVGDFARQGLVGGLADARAGSPAGRRGRPAAVSAAASGVSRTTIRSRPWTDCISRSSSFWHSSTTVPPRAFTCGTKRMNWMVSPKPCSANSSSVWPANGLPCHQGCANSRFFCRSSCQRVS